jgi:hypothetical protein
VLSVAVTVALFARVELGSTVSCTPKTGDLFQECQTGLPAEYSTIEQTFAPEALDEIVRWLQSVQQSKKQHSVSDTQDREMKRIYGRNFHRNYSSPLAVRCAQQGKRKYIIRRNSASVKIELFTTGSRLRPVLNELFATGSRVRPVQTDSISQGQVSVYFPPIL